MEDRIRKTSRGAIGFVGLAFLASLLALPVSAFAQAVNVSFRPLPGPVPTTAFGAAAGQGGVWNGVGSAPAGTTSLVDRDGNATSVDLYTDFNGFSTGGAAPTDQELLLTTYGFRTGGLPWTVTLSGVEPGAYRLYLYAHSDGTPIQSGSLTVEGVPIFVIAGSFFTDRPFDEQELGLSWNFIDVHVGEDGLVVIDSEGTGSGSSTGLAGLQLVPLSHLGVNVDFGFVSGEPPATFGAAANQTGTWNQVAVGTTILYDLGGAPSNLTAVVDTSSTGSGGSSAGSEGQLLSDYLFGGVNVGWGVEVGGLAPGSYDVYVYGPSNNSLGTGAMTIDGIDHPGLSGRSDSVLEQGVSWDVVRVDLGEVPLRLTGSGFITGISGLQIVPRVRQSLNIDLGFAQGAPPALYGAAGAAGHWSEAGVGSVTPLLDLAGNRSGVSVEVDAGGDFSSGSAFFFSEQLLLDSILSDQPYAVTLNGLASGPYRVFVYAPSSASVGTGPLSVEGVAIANLPGDVGSNLVEGVSWASADVLVGEDGLLEVLGAGVGGPLAGLAGLQVVSLAPQPVNVDLGADHPRPGDVYTAAAGQAGRWNDTTKEWSSLRNVANEVSGVALLASGARGRSVSSAVDDDEALLEDYLETDSGGPPLLPDLLLGPRARSLHPLPLRAQRFPARDRRRDRRRRADRQPPRRRHLGARRGPLVARGRRHRQRLRPAPPGSQRDGRCGGRPARTALRHVVEHRPRREPRWPRRRFSAAR